MIGNDLRPALAQLEAMKLEELRVAWVRRIETSPPKISAGLLRLALAHALQSKVLRGITKSTDRKLCELAAGASGPPPGTRLSRSWQGKLHFHRDPGEETPSRDRRMGSAVLIPA